MTGITLLHQYKFLSVFLKCYLKQISFYSNQTRISCHEYASLGVFLNGYLEQTSNDSNHTGTSCHQYVLLSELLKRYCEQISYDSTHSLILGKKDLFIQPENILRSRGNHVDEPSILDRLLIILLLW